MRNATNFFNADSIFLAELYRDVWIEKRALGDWFLTPAPSFFPDWILYFASHFIAGDWFYAWPLLGTLQILTMTIFTRLLYRRVAPDQTAWVWFVCGWVALLAAGNVDPFYCSLLTVWHFGSFLVFLALLYFIVQPSEYQSKTSNLVFTLLLAAITFSDRLIVIHFVLPLISLILLDFWRPFVKPVPRKALRRFGLLAVLGVGLGLLTYKLVIPHPTVYDGKIGLNVLGKNLSVFGANSWHLATRAPVAFVAIVWFYIAVAREFLAGKMNPTESRSALLVFCFTSAIVTFIILSLLSSAEVAARYWIPIVVVPILFAPLVLGRRSIIAILIVGLLHSFGFGISTAIEKPIDFKTTYSSDFSRCMDDLSERFDLHSGIATYWDVKPLRLFTKRHLNVATYRKENGRVQPFNWITSVGWIRETYDFAIVSQTSDPQAFSKEDLDATGSQPSHSAVCGDRLILIYKSEPLKFSTYDQ